jgi:hypothetical protein
VYTKCCTLYYSNGAVMWKLVLKSHTRYRLLHISENVHHSDKMLMHTIHTPKCSWAT